MSVHHERAESPGADKTRAPTDSVQIVLPERIMDQLADGLVALTAAIEGLDPDLVAHGLLGGSHGYGAHLDTPAFTMRPFCWCDGDNCRWCDDDACGCPNPPPLCFVDERSVTDSEFWKANKRILGPLPHDVAKYGSPEYEAASLAFDKSIDERDRRLKTVYQARVHVCEPAGMMADRPEGLTCEPSQTAPNFWHKPSGFKVWWYKYIGRSMETHGAAPDLAAMFAECVASLPHGAPLRDHGEEEGGEPLAGRSDFHSRGEVG